MSYQRYARRTGLSGGVVIAAALVASSVVGGSATSVRAQSGWVLSHQAMRDVGTPDHGNGLSGSPGLSTVVYTIRAFIDGRSEIRIDDDAVLWFHFNHAAPGRWGCPPESPTIINGAVWHPEWPDETNCENRFCDCFSDVFTAEVVLPNKTPANVMLTPIECRSACSIVVFPEESNGYRLSVEFDDPLSGPAWYEVLVELQYETCPADVDGSGEVDFSDLLIVLAQWGPCPPKCLGDIDGNGVVDFADLLLLLAAWGPCE